MRYLLIVLLLSGCSTATYKPYSSFYGVGYQDSKLSSDRFYVMYQGNGNSTPLEVKNQFMHRSAEITKENGCSFFEVLTEAPGAKANGPVNWASHSGEIKILKTATPKSFIADEFLAK